MWQISAAQTVRLRRAIRNYNRTVGKWAASGIYSSVPLSTTMGKEMEYISDNRSFGERIAQLERVMPSRNRHAADPTFYKGQILPKYMVNETRNIIRQQNAIRAEFRSEFFPLWDVMQPQERAAAISNRNIAPIDEDDYLTSPDYAGEEYDELLHEQYPNMPVKAEKYIDVWEDFNGDEDIPHIIRELAEKDPDGFRKLMESPDIEKEIEYIYPDGVSGGRTGKSGYNYKRESAFKGKAVDRMEKAADYWREQYWDYQNRGGYFA